MTDTVEKLQEQRDKALREISKWQTYGGQKCIEADALREALQSLLDVQNGPPLARNVDEWQAAVDQALIALGQKKAPDIVARLDDMVADVIWEDGNEDLATLLQDSVDEIERLRDALRQISHPPYGKVFCRDGHEEAFLIARSALGEDK
jgi:hypothetical protein